MHLLIPAAGSGKRMGAEHNKLLLPLANRPILAWSLLAAAQSSEIEWIGVICQAWDQSAFSDIVATLSLSKPVVFIRGGDTRQASVYNGLQALPSDAAGVLDRKRGVWGK
ncbi:MAG: NTP transferase domain-containing protein, partial [Leptolyngbya sp. SIO4C1]|nr:NTP transferase domain-containing protein [Leptolyngbya sp. SIO4C1]